MRQKKSKGFTIIEVVLVLAIAALIFMMVFIALPGLQRSQRDTQRREDMSRLITGLTQYSSNNRGNLPANQVAWNSLIAQYLTAGGDSFIDPAGAAQGSTDTTYLLVNRQGALAKTTFDSTDTQNNIYYATSAICNPSDGSQVQAAGNRKVAFRMVMEGGGVYCINN